MLQVGYQIAVRSNKFFNMRKIIWSWPLLFVVAASCLIVYSGYVFAKFGDESPVYLILSFVLTCVGVFLYSRAREKKKVPES